MQKSKLLYTKTGKMLDMPEWGYFGEYITFDVLSKGLGFSVEDPPFIELVNIFIYKYPKLLDILKFHHYEFDNKEISKFKQEYEIMKGGFSQRLLVLENYLKGKKDYDNIPKNPDHELNTLWGGACKDLVYGDGLVVMFSDNEVKTGDVLRMSCPGYNDRFVIMGNGLREDWYHNNSYFPDPEENYNNRGNLLVEYSKKLRGEENELAGLEELIK